MFKNQVALITGASSGIGLTLATELAKKHTNLVLVARSETVLEKLANDLRKTYGVQVHVIAGDLSHEDFIDQVVNQTYECFGQVDFLINSAGFGYFKPATAFSYAEIEQMFKVNTFAMMVLAQKVAERMKERQTGHIIFLGSMAGKMATVASSVYSASKFAIIGYANALRLELKADHIRVTTVNPGPVLTNFFNHDSNSQAYLQQVKGFALNPNHVAQQIIKSMAGSRRLGREINLPRTLTMGNFFYQCFPKVGDYLALNLFNLKEENHETR
ncbi:SDR family NAD(P)-dependent oxidoreductase [Vaginisenegalia massiliensis]|uniref:SDR family NAD(P)-dependent oxidoreductase n=1 Tax=Vaginisenegalia massiliensis TaxID=2058294 RepID=UPI000F532FE6|nr:SDR family oxidoreductase [Vaginisenegalia massiliensis]